jgi:hypothetical protein
VTDLGVEATMARWSAHCDTGEQGLIHDWPPRRAVAGFDLPPGTPVTNLWNVGDGVKKYANGGTTAAPERPSWSPSR